jgi:hypothetical protein
MQYLRAACALMMMELAFFKWDADCDSASVYCHLEIK